MKNIIVLISLLLLTFMGAGMSVGQSAEGFIKLSEKELIELAKTNSPSIAKIEASYLQAKAGYNASKDIFAPSLQGTSQYLKSNEKSLSTFVPVTKKFQTNTLQLNQPLSFGTSISGKIFSEKSTNNFLKDATTTGYGASVSLDLFKDLFGRISRANIEKSNLSTRRSKIESEIQTTAFSNNVRKIYWSIVANQEAQKITQNLLLSSQKQLAQTKKRFKSRVADRGEVARNHAQVASRKSQIISLNYQKADLFRQLKELVPDLADKNVEISGYDVNKAVAEVLACTALIKQYSDAPLDFTKYDEVVSFLEREDLEQKKLTRSHDGLDIKLSGDYESTGKAFNQSDAFTDFKDDNRDTYSVGIQFTIPLGSKKKDTSDIRRMVEKKVLKAHRDENLGKVKAYHSQTVKSIELLQEVVQNQSENSRYLNESLKVSKRKYNQARITVQQLIQDQDAFLQSNLDEIQSRLAVINTLLDYFTIYTDTPCDINRI